MLGLCRLRLKTEQRRDTAAPEGLPKDGRRPHCRRALLSVAPGACLQHGDDGFRLRLPALPSAKERISSSGNNALPAHCSTARAMACGGTSFPSTAQSAARRPSLLKPLSRISPTRWPCHSFGKVA